MPNGTANPAPREEGDDSHSERREPPWRNAKGRKTRRASRPQDCRQGRSEMKRRLGVPPAPSRQGKNRATVGVRRPRAGVLRTLRPALLRPLPGLQMERPKVAEGIPSATRLPRRQDGDTRTALKRARQTGAHGTGEFPQGTKKATPETSRKRAKTELAPSCHSVEAKHQPCLPTGCSLLSTEPFPKPHHPATPCP